MFRGRNSLLDGGRGMDDVEATAHRFAVRGAAMQLIPSNSFDVLDEATLRGVSEAQAAARRRGTLRLAAPTAAADATVGGRVTSLQAAALSDVLSVLQRRAPYLRVVIYPVPVQGAAAGGEIAAMLERAAGRDEVDVLLLVRGGGSIEDLWAFNEEVVARAIRAATLPVVVGVGHDSDVTIADFVADLRAPTPTAAAELVAPDASALRAELAAQLRRLTQQLRSAIRRAAQRVDYAQRSLSLRRARWLRSTRAFRRRANALRAAASIRRSTDAARARRPAPARRARNDARRRDSRRIAAGSARYRSGIPPLPIAQACGSVCGSTGVAGSDARAGARLQHRAQYRGPHRQGGKRTHRRCACRARIWARFRRGAD